MKLPDFPKRIEIEFTNRCNSKCVYCPRNFGVGNEGFISFELYKRIIDEAAEYPDIVLQLHRRGESLLHPDFIKMLDYIKGKFSSVQLATNAIELDAKRIKAIIDAVSFLSFSIELPSNYTAKRGLDKYKDVENNIFNFLKANKKTETQVSVVKDGSLTDGDIHYFKKLWIDRVDRVRIYEEHSINGIYGAIRHERLTRKLCTKPFTDMVIYWDGKVARCNHDWSNMPLGDVNKSAIQGIWNNDTYKRIRGEQLSMNFGDDVCKKCASWYPEEGEQMTGYVFTKKEK